MPLFLPNFATLSAEQRKESLRSVIANTMRILLSDNRVFVGKFVCVDNAKNVILHECREYTPMNEQDASSDKEDERYCGLVMLPGAHIKQIWIEKVKQEE